MSKEKKVKMKVSKDEYQLVLKMRNCLTDEQIKDLNEILDDEMVKIKVVENKVNHDPL